MVALLVAVLLLAGLSVGLLPGWPHAAALGYAPAAVLSTMSFLVLLLAFGYG